MGGEQEITGRDAVRLHFVQRLAGAGLRLAKDVTDAKHADTMRRLVEFLAYLSVPSLEALADQVMQSATGKSRDVWPSELVIRQMAEALERRPFEQAPIVTSWLASIEGPKAEAGGYLVQLFRHLRAHRRPILPYDLTTIRAQAGDDARRAAVIRDREKDGVAGEDDRRWLAEMADDRAQAQAIVDRGTAARAEKMKGEAA